MTADEELLAWLDVAKDFPLVGLSDLCVGAAARIRELIVQLEERETAVKKWHVQYDNAMEMLEAEREKRRLIEAQHVRLCDEVYEEDGETLKIVGEQYRANAAIESRKGG